MAKFIDTKRFQPVIYGGDRPHKHDLFNYKWSSIPNTEASYIKFLKDNNVIRDRQWWKKQYNRCINGFYVDNAIVKGGDSYVDGIDTIWDGNDVYFKNLDYTIKNQRVWIPGRMYFYLNFWTIMRKERNLKRKLLGPPRFTMLSWENWIIRELATQREKDILWAKRRQIGASYETACDLAYDWLFLRDSQDAIVAGQDTYGQITFKMVKIGIYRLINTQFYKWSSVDNKDLLAAKYFGTELHCRVARDNEQALSGLSPYKTLFEECGIFKKGMVRKTLEYNKQSSEAEGTKTGQNVYISTSGDMEEGVADIEHMFFNPDKYNLFMMKNIYARDITTRNIDVACFVPGWKFEIIDEDGNNLKLESIEKLIRDRNSKDRRERFTAIAQKPFDAAELFNIVSNGYFGEDIIQMLNERRSYILTHKQEQIGAHYSLRWVDSKDWFKGVDAIEDEDGEFYIIELPEGDSKGHIPENLYKMGVDSYDKDEANDSASKGSAHVFKAFKNANSTYKMFVARLVQRPKIEEGGAYKFYENTCKLCIMYNAINLIEWSNIRIFDYYRKNNMEGFLKERPDLTMSRYILNSKTNNPYGIDPSTKPHWLGILKDFLGVRENIDKLYDVEQIEAFIRFRYNPGKDKHFNCDVTISSSLALVCYEDEEELEVVDDYTKDLSDGVIVYRTDEYGNIKMAVV